MTRVQVAVLAALVALGGATSALKRSVARWLAATLAVLLIACGPSGIRDGGSATDDAGRPLPDTGVDAQLPPAVRITEPVSPAFVAAGSLGIQVEVTGPVPELVELLDGTAVLTALDSPYRYEWAVDAVAEGSHELTARARFEGSGIVSEPLTVVVDRTAPEVTGQRPDPLAPYRFEVPLEIDFSESLDPMTVDGATVTVTNGTGEDFVADLRLDAEGDTLTVEITGGPRATFGRVRVGLTGGITDLAGTPLTATDLVWDARTWIADEGLTILAGTGTDYITLDRPILRKSRAGEVHLGALASGSAGEIWPAVFQLTAAGTWTALPRACEEPTPTGGVGRRCRACFDLEFDEMDRLHVAVRTEPDTRNAAVCRYESGAWTRPYAELIASTYQPRSIDLEFGPTGEVAMLVWGTNSGGALAEIFSYTGLNWIRSFTNPVPAGTREPALLREAPNWFYAGALSGNWTVGSYTDDFRRGLTTTTTMLDPQNQRAIGFYTPSGLVFLTGCVLARQSGAAWTAIEPRGDASRFDRCGAAVTPSGDMVLAAHPTSGSAQELAIFLEEDGGLAEIGVGRLPTTNALREFALVIDGSGDVLVVYEETPGVASWLTLGLRAARLNMRGALP